jgi:hypothetical protein
VRLGYNARKIGQGSSGGRCGITALRCGLGTRRLSALRPDSGVAVGSVYALQAIADGSTLAHAIDKLGIDDSNVLDAVRAMYRNAIGENDRAVPDEQQRQDATSQLQGFTSAGAGSEADLHLDGFPAQRSTTSDPLG